MKFITGVLVGVTLVWLYGSKRARDAAAQRLRTGAEWASDVIETAPLPDAVKNTANDVAFSAWASADAIVEPQAAKETEHA